MQHVRGEDEGFLQIRDRQVSGGDAVVTGQHFAQYGMGARVQLRKLRRLLQRSPALRLRVARVRNRRANAAHEHGEAH